MKPRDIAYSMAIKIYPVGYNCRFQKEFEMPLYEYNCKDCNIEFEEVAPFAKADEVECNVCGSKNTERIASTFSSVTKASGSAAPGPMCGMGG